MTEPKIDRPEQPTTPKSNAELCAALAKAQAEMSHAAFDAENTHFRSKYATLASVIDAVRGPLTKHGIAFTQAVHQQQGAVGVETILHHTSGGQLSSGVAWIPLPKADAHALGSALTYGKRYSLALVAGIASDQDDDGNAAVAASSRQSNSPPPPAPNPDRHVEYDADVVPQGKHKGRLWSEVEYDYLEWLRDVAKPGRMKDGGLAELERRAGTQSVEQAVAAVEDDLDDDIPF